jgi:hypothetical protein
MLRLYGKRRNLSLRGGFRRGNPPQYFFIAVGFNRRVAIFAIPFSFSNIIPCYFFSRNLLLFLQ